jgi:hypothetical protein
MKLERRVEKINKLTMASTKEENLRSSFHLKPVARQLLQTTF